MIHYNKLSFFFAGATLIGAAACGSSVVDGGHASSSSSTSSSGASSGSSSSGSSSSSGGKCPGFADQSSPSAVTVRFVNQTPMPIYLPSLCSGVDYAIQYSGAGGGSNTSYVYDASCLQTCQALQTEPPYDCGACAPISYLVPANGSREVVWDGTGLESEQMPAACWDTPTSYPTCGRILAAQFGSYLASAIAYSACGGGCTCDGQGVCSGIASGTQASSTTTTFSFPASGMVEVIFDPCAFGCPGG